MAYNAAGIYVYCDVPGGDLHLGSLLAGARPAKYGLYSSLYLEYVEPVSYTHLFRAFSFGACAYGAVSTGCKVRKPLGFHPF